MSAARGWLDAGDREGALAEVDAALAIDPEFLAAQSLRERILSSEPASGTPAALPRSVPPDAVGDLPLRPEAIDRSPVSQTGYAKFEQRAKRRRVDRRLDASRAAIARHRLHEAAAALDEVIDLDPNTPELIELTVAFDDLRRAAAAPRRGAWLAAAIVFLATVLGASWLENAHATTAPPAPAPVTPAPGARADSLPAPMADEAALVKQALQRYRVAYDGLDAGSAQAVWPAVDEGALAKAFDGLESQTLTFDDCAVQLRNAMATATCRGRASYVPKIGSRESRTEPRVWKFSLRKIGGAWKIDTARVEP